MTYLLAAVVVLLGAAAVVLGGMDDSPGLQGIGVLIAVAGVVAVVRAARRRRSTPQA
jgi:membrane protein implicated in regulation of membrane protease activity